VNDQVVLKPATAIDPKSTLTVDAGPRFVSRGGEKLDAALAAFGIDVKGWVCADVGASTGGFTDCMLQRGAEKVYAIDVAKAFCIGLKIIARGGYGRNQCAPCPVTA
jgi:23S rRNA (cytidine1920-2'-O)/16S rRNA (cytidine1409-2'-O)-methyltransferase